MEVIADIKKILNQVLGRENMFDFETTLANQLYIVQCGWGNVYYTDKICRKTKCLWFCWLYSSCLFVVGPVILYLIYGRQTGDTLLLIYTGFISVIVPLYLFVKAALAMFRYRKDIEETILMADKILMKKVSLQMDESSNKSDMKRWPKKVAIGLYVSFLPYTFITILDMVLFYEDEKVKDFSYYPIPLSGLEHYASLRFYVFFNVVANCLAMPFFLIFYSYAIFYMFWVSICFNETRRIIRELNSLSMDMDKMNIESFKSIETKFRYILRRSIRDIDDLTRYVICDIERSESFLLI